MNGNLRTSRPGRSKHSILRDSGGFERRAFARRVNLDSKLSRAVTSAVEIGSGHGEAITVEGNSSRCIDGSESSSTARPCGAGILDL